MILSALNKLQKIKKRKGRRKTLDHLLRMPVKVKKKNRRKGGAKMKTIGQAPRPLRLMTRERRLGTLLLHGKKKKHGLRVGACVPQETRLRPMPLCGLMPVKSTKRHWTKRHCPFVC